MEYWPCWHVLLCCRAHRPAPALHALPIATHSARLRIQAGMAACLCGCALQRLQSSWRRRKKLRAPTSGEEGANWQYLSDCVGMCSTESACHQIADLPVCRSGCLVNNFQRKLDHDCSPHACPAGGATTSSCCRPPSPVSSCKAASCVHCRLLALPCLYAMTLLPVGTPLDGTAK